MRDENIGEMIQEKARRFGRNLALCRVGDGPEESYTYAELDEASGRLAAGLVAAGLNPGDRVAILCDSRPRWGVVFFATIRAGGVALPLDTRQSGEALSAIVDDAQPVFLFSCSGSAVLARAIAADHPDLQIRSLEAAGSAPEFPSMDDLAAEEILPCVIRAADDPAVLTYTSGTMGSSKGVVTTWGNLLFQVRAFRDVLGNDETSTVVSILPLSHLFELTAGFLGVLYGGGRVCYVNSLMPHEIAAAMREQRVTCMAAVPLFLRLLANSIRKQVQASSVFRRTLFRVLLAAAPLMPWAVRRVAFGTLHERFGGRLQYFVSGGAPLDVDTQSFFEKLGLPVYEGYGLAETSPVIATNGPSACRRGAVGRPLPGVEVRIGADGEILTRGPHVMHGYFRNEALTREVIDADGWLHTGDVGYLDADGFLFVNGRHKNIIVLGDGKKIQPEEIEAILLTHPDIEEGCVIGNVAREGLMRGSEQVNVVVVPTDTFIARCRENDEDAEMAIQRIIENRARRLAPWQRPSRIVIRREPLPRTTTRKIRRPDVRTWLDTEALGA